MSFKAKKESYTKLHSKNIHLYTAQSHCVYFKKKKEKVF